jgi:hypothetical protein
MNRICREAFERYPFGVIFSKSAPENLDQIDFETDFCYFYFSPGFERCCLLKRNLMCDGRTNAKRDFPDYVAYFNDDTNVMRLFTHGKVYAFCEPWSPPGVDTYIYTRKTAMKSQRGTNYMLGCFDFVDDVSLGIAKFKVIPHDAAAAIPDIGRDDSALDDWFKDAFENLPNAMAIFAADGTVVALNNQWKSAKHADKEAFTLESITELFGRHGYERTPARLMTSAAWVTGVTTGTLERHDENPYDVGTYGIVADGGDAYQVVVLRPSMKSVADPYWTAASMKR